MDASGGEKSGGNSAQSPKTDSLGITPGETDDTSAKQLESELRDSSISFASKDNQVDTGGPPANIQESGVFSRSSSLDISSNPTPGDVESAPQPASQSPAMDEPLDMTMPQPPTSSFQVMRQTQSEASVSTTEPLTQATSETEKEKVTTVPPVTTTSVLQESHVVEKLPAPTKPISIFAGLFPTPRPLDAPKSRTPTPPNPSSIISTAVPANNAPKPSTKTLAALEAMKTPTEQKQIKSEAITDTKVPFPEEKVIPKMNSSSDSKVENSGATGEIVTSASPQQTTDLEVEKKVGVVLKDDGKKTTMDGCAIDEKVESTHSTVVEKTTAKQLPIAGKTMKGGHRKSSATPPAISGTEPKKVQRAKCSSVSPGSKSKKKPLPPKEDGQDGRNDFYCWVCHKEGEVLCCELCPRVFHAKCLNMVEEPEGDWFCPECEKITDAECKETQSRAMSMLTIDQFSVLLKYVIQRMKIPLSEPFHEPVDTKMFPDYLDYVFHPMDLSTIEKNVKRRKYGCPEAFLCEFKWVIHNCVIYNSPQSKLTQTAKAMLKVAERELNEIEVCPECYLNSCRKRDNWFCEPCKELHPLVWAKLQGFPHWPAKALRIEKGLVDVRFFGQHDRAWIPLSGCYLISKELPLPIKNKKKSKGPGLKGGLDGAMQEMQVYIDNVKKITGEFEYAPPRTLLTHCDLYRKAGSVKTTQPAKQVDSDCKSAGATGKSEMTAKIELKDFGANKDPIKLRGLGSTTPKKAKTVTTSGEHPARSFATKKKKATMEFLNKTIESCKASLGIEKIQDVKMNSGSEETTSSSDEEENEAEEAKEKTGESSQSKKQEVPTASSQKPSLDEDDSDAELVIDLGDMEDNTDGKNTETPAESGPPNTDDGVVKKRKVDEPSSSKPPLKSILLNTPKPSADRKKMLAKALSEKIATGKRKHDVDGPPSGASPVTKVRKVHEQHEKRGASPSEVSKALGKPSAKEKEWKKSHHAGKYLEKESSGKIKTGILKSSTDLSSQRKEGGSEKRSSESLKHKHKETRDASQKTSMKKTIPMDKSGRMDKIPTEADARRLFNGGRIPRKNQVLNISDEEPEHKDRDDANAMETNQIQESRRRSVDQAPLNPRFTTTIRQGSVGRQISSEPQRKSTDENITLSSLKKYSDKVMDTVQKVFYEMYTDMLVPLRSTAGTEQSNAATATAMHEVAQMRLELERLKWMHDQEVAEIKHNHDLTVAEIRQSLEYEKKQLVLEAKVQAEAAKNRAVEETKRKQWCAYCNKEAIFYCCWNTSYCDYPCQQKHWPQHMKNCTQAKESAAQSGQSAGETKLSPPIRTSTTVLTTSTAVPTQPPKPVPPSSTSPGKSTFTLSASPGSITRLTSVGKSTILLPTITQASLSVATPKEKPQSKTIIISSDVKLQKTAAAPITTTQHQKSGSAISAIGARLLAAKQRSSMKEQSVTSSKTADVKNTVVTSPANRPFDAAQTFTDHVKTTMESPLSPDAKPPSPKNSASTIFSAKNNNTNDSKELCKATDESICPAKVKSELSSEPTVSAKSEFPTTASLATDDAVLSIAKATEPQKTASKSSAPLSKTVFSSPSAVASLIADMGTPLSSTLSSPETSSFSDTPEKKPEASKVQLSLGGSAFTKVVPDTEKPVTVQDTSTSAPPPTAATAPTATTRKESPNSVSASKTFKPIDREPSEDVPSVADMKEPETVPLIAPVLADSYLTKLQKTLVPKIDTPASPEQVMEEDQPTSKTELPRPNLPESDEDKQASISKQSDSDVAEAMETDNNG